MIRVVIQELESRCNAMIITKDWGGFVDSDTLAMANAVDKEKAEAAAQHLLNRLIYDAREALQGIHRLSPIQEFALAVLLEDPQACDAVRDVLGI
jgi:hypothetical protein